MKKPLILAALAICAACDLSTGTQAGPVQALVIDSTGHPYSAYLVQGHVLPYTYTMFGDALPDRMFENSFLVCSMSLSIAVRASFTICGIVLIGPGCRRARL